MYSPSIQQELIEFFKNENYDQVSDNSFRLNHFGSKDSPYDLISVLNNDCLNIYIRIFNHKYSELYLYRDYTLSDIKKILKNKVVDIIMEYVDQLNTI